MVCIHLWSTQDKNTQHTLWHHLPTLIYWVPTMGSSKYHPFYYLMCSKQDFLYQMDTKETQESFGLHFFPVITCNRLYWKEDKETIIGLISSTGSPPKNILLAQILAFELRRDSFKPEKYFMKMKICHFLRIQTYRVFFSQLWHKGL